MCVGGGADSKSFEAPLLSRAEPVAASPLVVPPRPGQLSGATPTFQGCFIYKDTQEPENKSSPSYLCDCGHVNAPLWAAGGAPLPGSTGGIDLLAINTRAALSLAESKRSLGVCSAHSHVVCQVPCRVPGGERQREPDPALRILVGYQGWGWF